MVNSSDIQTAYNKFYVCMRNYIWDFKTVDLLAELEIAIYHRFPNIDETKNLLGKLRSKINKMLQTDEELKHAYDDLLEVLSDTDVVFALVRDINY